MIKNVEKKQYLTEFIFLLLVGIIFIALFICNMYFIEKGFIYSIFCLILFLFVSVINIIITINYIKYKRCNKVLEGVIVEVSTSFRCYVITVEYEDVKYKVNYTIISSKIKDKINAKCSFVLLDSGKIKINNVL